MEKQRKMAMLAVAMIEDYQEVISGYIVDARIESLCLSGTAFKTFGYPNGSHLVTTEIMQVTLYFPSRWVVKTRDDESYVIASFARGGRQSLVTLAEKFEAAQLVHSQWNMH